LAIGAVNRVAGLPSLVIFRWASASVVAAKNTIAAAATIVKPTFILLDCMVPPRILT
jgi:hypothetical protein